MNDFQREMKEIGRHVVFVRLAKRLTQEQVAEISKVDIDLLRKIEAGTLQKRDNMALLKISNAMGASYDWMLSGEIPKEDQLTINEVTEKSLIVREKLTLEEQVILTALDVIQYARGFDYRLIEFRDKLKLLEMSLNNLGIERIKELRNKFYNQGEKVCQNQSENNN